MSHLLALVVVLHVSNLANAPAAIVRNAQAEVVCLFREIGVEVEWTPTAVPRRVHPPPLEVILLGYETGELQRSRNAVLGAALRAAQGTSVAYVFYRRVEAQADTYALPAGVVLACAIAHEVGHLLLPVAEHSAAGLMRACWDRADLTRAIQRQLRFSREEADLIRRRLMDE